MSRTVATVWHASLSTLAALLYFLFVLPRWWELTGFSPHALGTVLRIILGVLVGVTALPVAATWKRTSKPEFGTPQLALTLLIGSIVAHVVAGVLIAGTAVSEIWLSLDSAGMWLFGIYGAAAAIALLGIGAFYLSFIAEMPPPPPKPIKPKTDQPRKQRRWRSKKTGTAEDAEAAEDAEDAEDSEAAEDSEDTEDSEGAEDSEDGAEDDEDFEGAEDSEDDTEETAEAATDVAETDESAGEEAPELAPSGAQDPLRPSGKRRAKKGE